MSEVKICNISSMDKTHANQHEDYEYYKKNFIPRGEAGQCVVAVYEIPPKKSAFPYHSHSSNEECFYIISGTGALRTPEGVREVGVGDLIFFPANSNGAHKLTNNSDTQMLVYIDFDTVNDIDIAHYPDSNKIGVWGKNINKLYKIDDDVEYYHGE